MRHKDGLAAECRHFRCRKDFLGGHWVECAMGSKPFPTAWERNQYYRMICCGNVTDCELMMARKDSKGGDPRHE